MILDKNFLLAKFTLFASEISYLERNKFDVGPNGILVLLTFIWLFVLLNEWFEMLYMFHIIGASGEWVPRDHICSWTSKDHIRHSGYPECIRYLAWQQFQVGEFTGFVSHGSWLSCFCVYFVIFSNREEHIHT